MSRRRRRKFKGEVFIPNHITQPQLDQASRQIDQVLSDCPDLRTAYVLVDVLSDKMHVRFFGKEMIDEIFKAEDGTKPLSDHQVVQMLKAKGIMIARRTVAKYRAELGILPSNLRKVY